MLPARKSLQPEGEVFDELIQLIAVRNPDFYYEAVGGRVRRIPQPLLKYGQWSESTKTPGAMAYEDEYKLVEEEVRPYLIGGRTESAALLAWFLEAVWRVEPEEVSDSICDGGGDKGIDALRTIEVLSEIDIFQSKWHKKPGADQGDAALKNLVGAAPYFASPQSVDALLNSAPNPELTKLIHRLEIRDRVEKGAEAKRLVLVTNGVLDVSGQDYLKAIEGQDPPVEVWDLPKLAAIAARTRRPDLLDVQVALHAAAEPTSTSLPGDVEMAVALVPATELVDLPGIDDLSLFDRNVRLHEGRTRINKELAETIRDVDEHGLFPAYHNGLTVLTHKLDVDGRKIDLDGITVVNGCQSLVTLHDNRGDVTDDLSVLVKVIEVEKGTRLSDKITYRSNNQNPVDIRDQRSTDVIQRDLQQQVSDTYGSRFAFGIRQGETFEVTVLDNKTAAQFIMAIYVKEPWAAVRKVRLFDTDYWRIFNRSIDGHKLFLINLMIQVVDETRDQLRPEIASSFASVRFTIAYLLAQVLRETKEGSDLLDTPQRWLPAQEAEVVEQLRSLAKDVVDSVNFFIEEEEKEKGEAFDPKTVFKSRSGVATVGDMVLRLARRFAQRDESYLFNLPAGS